MILFTLSQLLGVSLLMFLAGLATAAWMVWKLRSKEGRGP